MESSLRRIMMAESEPYEHHGEEEGEGGNEEDAEGVATLVTVLILILMTIGFERVKIWIEERAHKTFEPVVEKMFGELAVLGFLSLCTFCIGRSHFFELISGGGGLDEGEIEEIVEMTHYVLFFIVLKSVHNCCLLIVQAESVIKRWEKFDRIVHIHGRATFLNQKKKSSKKRTSFARSALPSLAEDSLFLKFCALEEEFHLDRGMDPPFDPAPADHRLDDNFNFAAYLGHCLEKILEELVEIKEPTYWIFALFAVVYYGYNSLLSENTRAIAWIWVGLQYTVLGLNTILVSHLSNVAEALGADSGSKKPLDESTSPDDGSLPAWCSIELNKEDKRKHRNRQEKLFLFQREGIYMTILQTNLVFSSIYWALLFLSYFPYMYKEQKVSEFCVYVVVAFIPSQFTNKQWISILTLLTEVLSVGHLRQPRLIAAVIRDQKIESMIRSFLMIRRVDDFVKSHADPSSHNKKDDFDISGRSGISTKSTGSNVMLRKRVQKAFNAMDQNGDGVLDEAEFELLLESLGMPVTHQMGHTIVCALDNDGDGVICVEELEEFYKGIMDGCSCPHDMAKDLFTIFDNNGNGHITPNEFAHVLDGLNLGFSVDDIGQILQEVDEDGDGEITFHEFQRVIEEYMPAELFGEDTEEEGEFLSVHPLLTAIERIGSTFQNCFSGKNQQEASDNESDEVLNSLLLDRSQRSYGSLATHDTSDSS